MTDHYEHKPWIDSYPEWLTRPKEAGNRSILDDFEATLKAKPERPCVHYFNTTYTYAQLAEMARGLAGALARMGIEPGDRIALMVQNIPQAVIASLAGWSLAATIVPINPMYTARELQHLVLDSRARVIICQDDLYSTVRAGVENNSLIMGIITTSPLDLLDPSEDLPAQLRSLRRHDCPGASDLMDLVREAPLDPSRKTRPDGHGLAYLVYTSGTTGPPKGARLTHRNIVYNARIYEAVSRLDETDVVLGVAPLFHISGIVAHLAVGFYLGLPVTLCHRFEVVDILRLIEKYRTTFTVASITVYTALLNHPESGNFDLGSFTKAYSGGAPVSPATVRNFREAFGLTIYNVYGLTESASPATITPLGFEGPVDEESGALSVGLIIPGLEAWIVDVEDPETTLPPGEAGELVLRGPCMVDGYWEKPEETAKAIRDGRFFTGDVAKIDDRGWCYIVDRKKDLINVSGYKVWPREVEDILYQHPAVREAAVIGVPDEYRGETVMAFVALKAGYPEEVHPAAIIDFCKTRMAAFKYPRKVEILDEIPKTSTGKYLRRELRARFGPG